MPFEFHIGAPWMDSLSLSRLRKRQPTKIHGGQFHDANNILTTLLLGTNKQVVRRGAWRKTRFSIVVVAWRDEGGYLQKAAAFAFIGGTIFVPQPDVAYCVLTRAVGGSKTFETEVMAAAFLVMRRRVIAALETAPAPD